MDNNLNNGQQFQQPQFQQPIYQQPVEDTSVMSVGQWMLTTLILALPCAGIIMAFVWGFGNGNLNRKNFCRSWLIWQAIAIGICLLFFLVCGSVIFATLGELSSNPMYY